MRQELMRSGSKRFRDIAVWAHTAFSSNKNSGVNSNMVENWVHCNIYMRGFMKCFQR
jgi:hypothetical protein